MRTGNISVSQQEYVDFIAKTMDNEIPGVAEKIMNLGDRLIQQGRQEGRQEGGGAMLLRQLQFKFKTVPDSYQQKIAQADADTLLKWGERVLSASTIGEVFADFH